jgi:hypothetical protein
MRRREDLQPIGEVAGPTFGNLFPTDPGPFLHALLHLAPGTLAVELRGEEALLATEDRSVRLALEGLEGDLLRHLASAGYRIRRITWRSR